jgi:serine/threonine protein kinase
MRYITVKPPPVLPSGFSEDFKDFISICMRKQGGTRLSAAQLLKHPFIKRSEKLDMKHLQRWMQTI